MLYYIYHIVCSVFFSVYCLHNVHYSFWFYMFNLLCINNLFLYLMGNLSVYLLYCINIILIFMFFFISNISEII